MKKILLFGLAIALVAGVGFFFLAGGKNTGPATTENPKALINQGQQMATAWQAYHDKNNQPPAEVKQVIAAQLLPALPAYPAAAGGVPAAPWSIAASGTTYYAFADAGAPPADTAPGKGDANAALCQSLNNAAGKTPPEHYQAEAPGQLVADPALGNGTFGCGIVAGKPPLVLPGSGLFPVIGHYTFFYKLG
jgi:hypothetical protein